MATARQGWTDANLTSHLNWLRNTAFPAQVAQAFIGLFIGTMCASDGTGGTAANTTRPAITLGVPATDLNGRLYSQNTAAVSNMTLTNTSPGEIVGFGIYAAASGGNPLYFGQLYPFPVQVGTTPTLQVGAIKVYAEPPTIS